MGYRALINKNVAKAFTLLKDLAEEITLTKKTATNFNFNTLAATDVETAPVITKAVITDASKYSRERNVNKKVMLLKTQDIGEIALYDKILYNGQTWLIGPPIISDTFITVVEVQKEV